MTLIQNLPAGTACTIISIEGDGAVARRARELGLVAGTVCTVIRKAPFGGPIEIATAVSRIGIRPSDGVLISVEVLLSTGQVAA